MREELIPKSNFRVGVKAADWEEAVRAAGQILLDNGSIEQKYIEDMIQAAHDLGEVRPRSRGSLRGGAAQ